MSIYIHQTSPEEDTILVSCMPMQGNWKKLCRTIRERIATAFDAGKDRAAEENRAVGVRGQRANRGGGAGIDENQREFPELFATSGFGVDEAIDPGFFGWECADPE